MKRIVALLFLLSGNLYGNGIAETRVVNVYSHRNYDSDRALYAQFTKLTGIQVNLVEADADKLIERMKAEGIHGPADILITTDVARLERAREAGLLKNIRSTVLENAIPSHLRHPQGAWFGLTKRARVIVYNKTLTTPEALQSYESLALPAFQGKVLMRSSANAYNQSLVASFVAHNGPDKTLVYLKSLVANFARAPQGGDTDNIKAVALGVGTVTWSNTYYLGKLLGSTNPEEVKLAQTVGLIFPDQEGTGTHVNISGAGVSASSSHEKEALAFLEFLVSDEAQRSFALANFEYPVKSGVEMAPVLKAWGTFKEDGLNLAALGTHNAQALRLMNEAGWK